MPSHPVCSLVHLPSAHSQHQRLPADVLLFSVCVLQHRGLTLRSHPTRLSVTLCFRVSQGSESRSCLPTWRQAEVQAQFDQVEGS